jgi:hypothetical protein
MHTHNEGSPHTAAAAAAAYTHNDAVFFLSLSLFYYPKILPSRKFRSSFHHVCALSFMMHFFGTGQKINVKNAKEVEGFEA